MIKLATASGTLILVLTASAWADPIPEDVKAACQSDFETHCKQHAPESDVARSCMTEVFEKLSEPCVTAILGSSLVPETPEQGHALAEDAAPQAETATSVPAKSARRVAKQGGQRQTADRRAAVERSKPRKPKVAQKSERRFVRHRGGTGTRIAGYIRRGPAIANRYLARFVARPMARFFR
jgi:hypothetical protein